MAKRVYVQLPSGARAVVGSKVYQAALDKGLIEAYVPPEEPEVAETDPEVAETIPDEPVDNIAEPVAQEVLQAAVVNESPAPAPTVDGQGRQLFASKTDAVAVVSRKLLRISPPSRDIGWNKPWPRNVGPRQA